MSHFHWQQEKEEKDAISLLLSLSAVPEEMENSCRRSQRLHKSPLLSVSYKDWLMDFEERLIVYTRHRAKGQRHRPGKQVAHAVEWG